MVDWCLFDYLLEYFPSNSSFRLCKENYEFVLGWGIGNVAHSCPHWTGIPHPACPRCRGKICTRDMTCDFCVGWSPVQWELFAKKRAYKDRKKSRTSGSVPPAPRAGTSSEVPQPGTSSSSSSRPSGGQDKRGGVSE